MCVCKSSLEGCSLELAENGSLAFTQNYECFRIMKCFRIMNVYYECEYYEQVAWLRAKSSWENLPHRRKLITRREMVEDPQWLSPTGPLSFSHTHTHTHTHTQTRTHNLEEPKWLQVNSFLVIFSTYICKTSVLLLVCVCVWGGGVRVCVGAVCVRARARVRVCICMCVCVWDSCREEDLSVSQHKHLCCKGIERHLQRLPPSQYLYFCTSKASKLQVN
jgi:hypothetical protein